MLIIFGGWGGGGEFGSDTLYLLIECYHEIVIWLRESRFIITV